MSNFYDRQLVATKSLLDRTEPEMRSEGARLLFDLWKENIDNNELKKEIQSIALIHTDLLQQFRGYIYDVNDLRTVEFLESRLEALVPLESSQSELPMFPSSEVKQLPINWIKPLVITIASCIAILGFIYFRYIFPYYSEHFEGSEWQMIYTAPTYISKHDENEIEISITNTSQEELEGFLAIVFDTTYGIKPVKGDDFSREIEIPIREQYNDEFKFILARDPDQDKVNYHFEFTPSKGKTQIVESKPL